MSQETCKSSSLETFSITVRNDWLVENLQGVDVYWSWASCNGWGCDRQDRESHLDVPQNDIDYLREGFRKREEEAWNKYLPNHDFPTWQEMDDAGLKYLYYELAKQKEGKQSVCWGAPDTWRMVCKSSLLGSGVALGYLLVSRFFDPLL